MASSTAINPRPGGPKINADLREIAQEVRDEFANRLDADDVDECLDRVACQVRGAKVRSFVPLLVRRYVRDELQERLAGA